MSLNVESVGVCEADAHKGVYCEYKWVREGVSVGMCVLGGYVISIGLWSRQGFTVGPQLSFWKHEVGFRFGDAFWVGNSVRIS